MEGGYRSPLLSLPGAVPATGCDDGVAEYYGDPLREQRLLVEGKGFVDFSHRGVVRVEGGDRLRWLNDLTTQRLLDLPPGVGTETLVLSPHGHVEHHLSLVDDGNATWIHVEPGTSASLVDFLQSMRFLLDVDPRDVTEQWAVVWQPIPEPYPDFVTRVDARDDALAGREIFFPRDRLADVPSLLGPPIGLAAWNALRIEAGRPRLGVDTDHRTIPHEVGWIGSAVHLAKGCYRGQETVARVSNLGRPPRRLVRLHLDGSVREQLPRPGAEIVAGDDVVGVLTSAAYHFELGPIALGLVKYATDDTGRFAVREQDGTVIAANVEAVVRREEVPPPGQQARAALRLGAARLTPPRPGG
ncbi:MAG: folate-binding protein YgfZ [Acidothermus sp.]|nr:folate-binding protein YgfZ [Acidothermus sp.]MCL6537283.1 folate-binding protein [Acidothermus sp.]